MESHRDLINYYGLKVMEQNTNETRGKKNKRSSEKGVNFKSENTMSNYYFDWSIWFIF